LIKDLDRGATIYPNEKGGQQAPKTGMTTTARVEIIGDRAVLIAPYNSDLPAGARELGRRWDGWRQTSLADV
jgi:hypothetical protein